MKNPSLYTLAITRRGDAQTFCLISTTGEFFQPFNVIVSTQNKVYLFQTDTEDHMSIPHDLFVQEPEDVVMLMSLVYDKLIRLDCEIDQQFQIEPNRVYSFT